MSIFARLRQERCLKSSVMLFNAVANPLVATHRLPGRPELSLSKASFYKTAMRTGHAAAIALVGWYLLLPPTIIRQVTSMLP